MRSTRMKGTGGGTDDQFCAERAWSCRLASAMVGVGLPADNPSRSRVARDHQAAQHRMVYDHPFHRRGYDAGSQVTRTLVPCDVPLHSTASGVPPRRLQLTELFQRRRGVAAVRDPTPCDAYGHTGEDEGRQPEELRWVAPARETTIGVFGDLECPCPQPRELHQMRRVKPFRKDDPVPQLG
jgi:hypothetical protein